MACYKLILVIFLKISSILCAKLPLKQDPSVKYEYPFEIVADYDKKAISADHKNTFVSSVQIGSVFVQNGTILDIGLSLKAYDITTKFAFNGRGAELSELLFFHEKLLTFDDKSGIIYELAEKKLVPWVILADGAGNETSGFKCEWATVKDDHILVGSHGVESVTPEGEVTSRNSLFVKKISKNGEVIHENWQGVYDKIRGVLGMPFPGFVVHEAALWSDENQKWIFLPRKCTAKAKNSVSFDNVGCNYIILANEDFSDIETYELSEAPIVNHRGFSSFQFLPDSGEKVIVGLTTIETDENVATYIIALDLKGKILFPETKILYEKFEGLTFLHHLLNETE